MPAPVESAILYRTVNQPECLERKIGINMEEQGRSLCIVPMQPQHIDQLERLEKECFSAPWSYDALVSELSNPLAVFRVAQQPDGSVAGYVGMHHIVDEGFICNIAVFSQYRRQGVATALMQELDDYAKENEMASVSLEVRQSNLYEKSGFEVVGKRRNFYVNPTEDALIMTKTYGGLF